MKDPKLDFLSAAFGTLEGHDLIVDTVILSRDFFECGKKFHDDGTLWNAKMRVIDGENIIKIISNKGWTNSFRYYGKPLDIDAYHHGKNPGCTFCQALRMREAATIDENDLEAKMRPGRSSDGGFLGPSDKLSEVIERDRQTLERLQITYKQIADRMEVLIGKARRLAYIDHWKNKDYEYEVEEKFRIKIIGWCGFQDCPWCGHAGGAGSHDYKITNIKTGEILFVPELIMHLIRAHQFFEGNTNYRVDPNRAIRVLEIEKDVDYTPKYSSEIIWSMREGSSAIENRTPDFKVIETRQLSPKAIMHIGDEEMTVIAEDDFEFKEAQTINGAILRNDRFWGYQKFKKQEIKFIEA